jgi:hypothetical protein
MNPWRDRAPLLAEWAWHNLVNRADVWGAYYATDRRRTARRADGTEYVQKSWTAPAKADRGRVSLTPAVLAAHFRGTDGCIVGLHTTSQTNACRWWAIEVDRHEGDGADAWANLRAMLHWRDKVLALGMDPLLTDSNGDGGYHLRGLFERPVPAPRVFAFLRQLTADHATLGLPTPPETFPKQPVVAPGRYGNWLRVPGKHHTRDHWTRVCCGGSWAEGGDAIGLMLDWRPDSPDLIPPPAPEDMPRVANAHEQPPRRTWANDPADDRDLALRCLDAVANGDCHYDRWVNVGMALHSVDAGNGMLREWVDWSRRSGKFTEGECERKWQSFNARRGRRVTLGTLIHLARQAGADVDRKGRAA